MGYGYYWATPSGDKERDHMGLNIHTGGVFGEYMVELGMAFDAPPPPEFPQPEAFGLTDTEVWEEGPEGWAHLTPDQVAARDQFHADEAAVIRWHGPEIPGIPVHKVAWTNDGWHVTVPEIKAALAIHDALPPGRVAEVVDPEYRAYWDRWITYLREAAAHGDGFRTW